MLPGTDKTHENFVLEQLDGILATFRGDSRTPVEENRQYSLISLDLTVERSRGYLRPTNSKVHVKFELEKLAKPRRVLVHYSFCIA